jgi:excisionase family DNA binding protein
VPGDGGVVAGLRAGDLEGERVAAERFLQLADVAEILNISASQTYALVRSGELPAIKIGGRGQWRVERTQLEEYIQRAYAETRAFVDAHPLGREAELLDDEHLAAGGRSD